MQQKEISKSTLGFDATLSSEDTDEAVVDGRGRVAAEADWRLNSTPATGKLLQTDPGAVNEVISMDNMAPFLSSPASDKNQNLAVLDDTSCVMTQMNLFVAVSAEVNAIIAGLRRMTLKQELVPGIGARWFSDTSMNKDPVFPGTNDTKAGHFNR